MLPGYFFASKISCTLLLRAFSFALRFCFLRREVGEVRMAFAEVGH